VSIEKRLLDPASRKPKPDPETLQFGKAFTDHMLVVEYDSGEGWHDARIEPYAPFPMSPSAMVLHYGQAVFEGLKCYKAVDGRLLLFRPELNFKRLNTSDDRLCIPYIDEEFALSSLIELLKVEKDWVPSLEGTSLYIRPFVFATESALGVHPAHSYLYMVILSPVGPYYKEGVNPVRIVIEDEYVRSIKGGIGFTKGAANYAISLKGQEKAQDSGFTQVLWLDGVERKYIEEVGTMNVFFVIGGTLVTPALSGSILPGVTRDSCIAMAKSWGIPVEERKISAEEIFEAHESGRLDEAFGSGTAAVISPIGELSWQDRKAIVSGGKTGPLALRLYNELTGIQYGKLPDKFGWVKEVTLD
jgi:branched-chain amino acid aminotransferase